MNTHLDSHLAEKIVHEVKSQGVFDEFRKDVATDVDTKPAYQNLHQRVESVVQKFLSEQKWTPETNKYQLRERLRRHIVESGFLDVGVERIVDQVVNPKIGSVFQPRIEEIAYKFLGIAPPVQIKPVPPPPLMHPLLPFPMNGNTLKVDTGSTINLLPTDLEQVSPDSDKVAIKEEDSNDEIPSDDKVDDDDESPPFEPLTNCKSPIKIEKEETVEKHESVKSEIEESKSDGGVVMKPKEEIIESKPQEISPVKEEGTSADGLASQESQLSQVSSDSRISTTSNQLNRSGNDVSTTNEHTAVNISEEAQMPKFNENSTEVEGSIPNTTELHFDIKKDEIKFEGTERKSNILDGDQMESAKPEPNDAYISNAVNTNMAFNFKLNVENVEPCTTTQDAGSCMSSQDDTSSAQLCIVERPENELQADTSSAPKEESSTATITSNIVKNRDEKHERGKHSSTSSSSSTSRHKKSSKDKRRRTPEPSRRHDSHKDKGTTRERYSESKHSSTTATTTKSSSKYHSSSNRHSSSSKHTDKERHRSSSSRSESRSRHDSSKRNHRDKYELNKRHKSSSSKEPRNGEQQARVDEHNDDHNESKEKIRRRKSTDSNDDKGTGSNATGGRAPLTTAAQETNVTNGSTSTTTLNTKTAHNESRQHAEGTKKKVAVSDNQSEIAGNSSSKPHNPLVVILSDILQNSATDFVDIEAKSCIQVHASKQRSLTPELDELDKDLLYFEQTNGDLQARLNLINDAIDRCRTIIQDFTCRLEQQRSCADNATCNEKDSCTLPTVETQATLLVDCHYYSDKNDESMQKQNINTNETLAPPTPKRLKLNVEHSITKITPMSPIANTKENEMNEKNAIVPDAAPKKSMTTLTNKRNGSFNKLTQQQRYSSEDLYKPRPVLGQRSKRRGFDALL